jgi:hypothetical protein
VTRPQGTRKVLTSFRLAAVIGVALTLNSCGESETSKTGATSQASRLEELDRNLQAVEAGERAAPRDRWDPEYVVEAVGRDPAKLFAWVKDNTYWIPYRGMLRGPVGVLMDAQGNSLDQSLLLATVLDKAGHSVRLAHGELQEKQAVAHLPSLVARHAAAFAAPGEVDAELAQRLQAAATRFMKGRAGAPQTNDIGRILSKLETRVADQAKRLLRAVGRPDPADEWSVRFGDAVAALRDHWWVQRRHGNGWVDMDLLASGSDGSRLAVPTEFVQLEDVADVPHHEIVLRVITEQWSSGAVAERTALEHVLRPADLVGQSIVLQFWPVTSEDDEAPPAETALDARSRALEQRRWAAFLLLGKEIAAGAILPESGDDLAATAGGPMGGIAGAFGAPPKAASRKKALSAVWLEYEIRSPGAEPRKTRRTVFDLIGPAARANGTRKWTLSQDLRVVRAQSLMMRTEILPLVAQTAPEFVAHLVAASLLGNRELLRGAARGDASFRAAAFDIAARSASTVSPLYGLALAQWANTDSRRVYVDRPLLLTSHAYPQLGETKQAIVQATDIVANEIGVSLVVSDAFALRLAQGVRDTNLESLLRGPGAFGNAGDAFAASSADSSDWTVLSSEDLSATQSLDAPSDAKQRILAELRAGYAIVAPKRTVDMEPAPFFGWWRIDPVTGGTLGFAANGWGQGAEYADKSAKSAGVWGRYFVPAFKRFAAGFSSMYGWCLAPLIQQRVGSQGMVGFQLAVSDSVGECVGDSIFVGALATMPLVVLTVNRAPRFRAPYEPPKPPEPKLPEPKCRGQTEPMADAKTHPDLSDTQMPRTEPDLSDTSPDRSKTQYDPNGHPKPEPARTTPRPKTVEEARENYAQSRKRVQETDAASQEATEQLVRYRQNRPGRRARLSDEDPANWDEEVHEAYQQDAERADAEHVQAIRDFKQAESDLKDLAAAARRRAGQCGL